MKLFDTHAHLDSDQLAESIEQVILDAQLANLIGITAIGTTVESSQNCLKLAERFDMVYAAVGIHPNQCKVTTDSDWDNIVELSQHPMSVAIGETGLDRYWDYCPIETQRHWFGRHIELSHHSGLPLVVHMRDCESDIVELLSEYASEKPINGIMHSYSGSWETANVCLDLGMHISFAGMVTFKNAESLRRVAAQVPLDRLLIETDSPYLTPHPYRGQRPNTPAMVGHTAACLASVFDVSPDKIAEITTTNAKRIFGIR